MNEKPSASQPWSQNARSMGLLLTVVGAGLLLYLAQVLIGPLVIAALIAYVVNPIVTFVNERTRLPRSIVVALLYVLSLTALIWLTVALVPLLSEQYQLLEVELQEVVVVAQESLNEQIDVFGYQVEVGDILNRVELAPRELVGTDQLLEVLNAATANLVWVLLIMVTTFYLLQDWAHLRDWAYHQVPPKYQPDMARLYSEIRSIWYAYLRGQLLLMLIIGVATGLLLSLIGLPGAIALGLVTGILDVIPTLGPSLAMLVAAVVAWFQGASALDVSNAWAVVVVLSIYGIIQAIEGVWLRPRILGSSVRLHPAIVFIGLIAALTLVGALGALIVVPMIGTFSVLGRYLRCRVLGLEPWVTPVAAPAPTAPAAAEEPTEPRAASGQRQASEQI